MKPKVLPIIVGIVGILVISSWMFLIAPDLKNNPEYFETFLEAEGKSIQVNSIRGISAEPTLHETLVRQDVVDNDGNILKIVTSMHSRDIVTKENFWEYEHVDLVDRTTRKFLEKEDAYFLYPYNTQKQDYNFWTYVDGAPFETKFVKTDYLKNLEVYVFESRQIFDLSGTFSQFPTEQIEEELTVTFFVEPITGKFVAYEAVWKDWVIRDGEKILIVDAFDKTTEYSRTTETKTARDQIQLFYLYDTVIPILLVAISAGLVLVVFVNQNLRTRTEELEHSKKEKWEILGKLSANLAHDIRNPLTTIKNSSKIIMKDVHEPSLQNEFDRINRNIKRIVHQVEEVLGFVKDSPLNIQKTTFQQILDSALFSLDISQNIDMEISKNDFDIECDKEKIEIVFINIILNAIQAIDQSSGKILIRLFDENDKIKIEIENNGPSIPDDILPKVFESLFTTKFEGTGLGLFICENIVKRHGGTISVTSPPTIFTITLPTLHYNVD